MTRVVSAASLAAIAGSLVTLLILIVLWHKQGEDRRLAEQYGRMVGGYQRCLAEQKADPTPCAMVYHSP